MKQKKRKIEFLISMLLIIFCTSCMTVPVGRIEFEEQTGVDLQISMRFFTWLENQYSSRVLKDMKKGKLTFTYDPQGDYLVKFYQDKNVCNTIWGNQLMLEKEYLRTSFFVTPFVPAVYALSENYDPVDLAFDVLNTILSDSGYKFYEEEIMPMLREGLKHYRAGNEFWQTYKSTYFYHTDDTIMILFH